MQSTRIQRAPYIYIDIAVPVTAYNTYISAVVSVNKCRLKMQSLQQKASEWSGVSIDDAFGIDDTNLFQKLGLQTFINLSTNFYNR